VLGGTPAAGPAQLARVGFLAQDAPLYTGFSVADHLKLGARLNPRWDAELALDRVDRLDLDPGQKAGTLSGGERAQLALTLAVAKHPELLILDEPVASLDRLARREFLQDLMEAVAEHELSVVLSSHRRGSMSPRCLPPASLQVRQQSSTETPGSAWTNWASGRSSTISPPAATGPSS